MLYKLSTARKMLVCWDGVDEEDERREGWMVERCRRREASAGRELCSKEYIFDCVTLEARIPS